MAPAGSNVCRFKRPAYSNPFAMSENSNIFITMQPMPPTKELYSVTLTAVDWIDTFTWKVC